jgi:L-arabinokinase
MGGIADYSGANVCEAVLGGGMLMALQARTDRTLRIRTMQAGHRTLPGETRTRWLRGRPTSAAAFLPC